MSNFVSLMTFSLIGMSSMKSMDFQSMRTKRLKKIETEKKIKGIHLYSLARPSEQPSKDRLTRLTQSEIEDIAVKIQALNIPINIYS